MTRAERSHAGRVSRMRAGEWVAAVGSVGLLVVLFLDWFALELRLGHGMAVRLYAPAAAHTSGWGSLGWFLDVLLAVSIFGGLALTYATVRRTSPAWAVGGAVLTVVVGALTWLILLIRVLTQPDLGLHGLPNAAVSVQLPAYLGLLFAAAIPVGAWLALRDERLDAPESAYTPPPPRPVPGT